MKNFFKYLPQSIVLILETLIIWITIYSRIKNGNVKELLSLEYFLFLFVIVILGYGIANAAEPKKTGQEVVDEFLNDKK